ncbi:NEDD8 precursor, putative [Perkinsus marinus ATCC 50983]|uniref:NEDD8, putative n=1 Tax=Perkinsus marinus (strain ATCC 50983 / TXsc) TaxID=423536 RepID=C5KEG9_PERM5|nr:NEDD8 precursor, putative [Perkinsus marinus ATCC 50983]EER17107.1 NEDD8 precursor, putative [Perkinsus marinus ATCC 50983]|eukprot:XP_002785311.1 NEDD8 precursor, putative [Perkinsus marinus ATCC 50983]
MREVVVVPPPPPPLLLFVVNVKTAATVWVEISQNDKVSMLKKYTLKKTGIPVEEQILLHSGEELKDEYVLKDCGALRDRNVVHLVDRRDAPGEMTVEDASKEEAAIHGVN